MSLRCWIHGLIAIAVAAAGPAWADDKPTAPENPAEKPPEKLPVAVDRSYMAPAVSPCKDFYTYANGAFDKVPIPGEYPAYGVNQEINESQFRHPQGNPGKLGTRTGGPERLRRPARRRFLRLRHGRGGRRSRRAAAASSRFWAAFGRSPSERN